MQHYNTPIILVGNASMKKVYHTYLYGKTTKDTKEIREYDASEEPRSSGVGEQPTIS